MNPFGQGMWLRQSDTRSFSEHSLLPMISLQHLGKVERECEMTKQSLKEEVRKEIIMTFVNHDSF